MLLYLKRYEEYIKQISSSSFNPYPSLSSVAKDSMKQFLYLNIVLRSKTGPFFWSSEDAKTVLSFLKRQRTVWHSGLFKRHSHRNVFQKFLKFWASAFRLHKRPMQHLQVDFNLILGRNRWYGWLCRCLIGDPQVILPPPLHSQLQCLMTTGYFDTFTCNVPMPQGATRPRTSVIIKFIPHVMITEKGDMLLQQRFKPFGEDGISDT